MRIRLKSSASKKPRLLDVDKNYKLVTIETGDLFSKKNFNTFNYLFKIAFANFFVRSNSGLLLHGASISNGNKGWVFCGDKGTGKSTVFNMFLTEGYQGLSDDVAIIRLNKGSALVYCSPFHERHDFERVNSSYQLDKLFFLYRSDKDHTKKLDFSTLLSKIFYHSYGWGLRDYADATLMKKLRIMAYEFAEILTGVEVYADRLHIDKVTPLLQL